MSRHEHFKRWLTEQRRNRPDFSNFPDAPPRSVRAQFSRPVPPTYSLTPLPPIPNPPPLPPSYPLAQLPSISSPPPLPPIYASTHLPPAPPKRSPPPSESRSGVLRVLRRSPWMLITLAWLLLVGLGSVAIVRLLDPLFSKPIAQPVQPSPAPEVVTPPPSIARSPSEDANSPLWSLGAIVVSCALGTLLISRVPRRG